MAMENHQGTKNGRQKRQFQQLVRLALSIPSVLLLIAFFIVHKGDCKINKSEGQSALRRSLKEESLLVVLISDRIDAIITSVGSIVEASSSPVDFLLIGDSATNENVRQHFGGRLGSFLSMTTEDIEKDLVSQGYNPIWTWDEWHSSRSPDWKNDNTLHVADWDNLHTHEHELNHLRFYIPLLSFLQDTEHAYLIDDDILVRKDLNDLAKTTMADLDSSKGLVSPCNIWKWSDECHVFEFKNQDDSIVDTPPLYGNRPVCKSHHEEHCVPEHYWDFIKKVMPEGGEKQPAWNFGLSLLALRNWNSLQLTEKYEAIMRESYRLHVFPETSLSFGLGVSYLAFAGAVECWNEDSVKVRDGFGFVEWERYQQTFGDDFFSTVDVAHYTGPEKPWTPFSAIEAVASKPWHEMMRREKLPLPAQLPEEPTNKVFSLLTSHNSESEWFMSVLDKHPQVCAAGETDRPEFGFPTEALSSHGLPWLPNCSVKKGCTFSFVRDSVWSLTAGITHKHDVPPRCAADYDPILNADPLVEHLGRLCNFVRDLSGDFSIEAIVLKWTDAFVAEDKSLLGCGCKRGSRIKGLKVMADWIASGENVNPGIPNLNETQFRGANVVRLKRRNLWHRYMSLLSTVSEVHARSETENGVIDKGHQLHVPVELMLQEINFMLQVDQFGDKWAEAYASDVLWVEYEDCISDPATCFQQIFDFIGVDSSKWGSSESFQALLPPSTVASSTNSILDNIANKEEVMEALGANGWGDFIGLEGNYTDIQLLVYETAPHRQTPAAEIVRHASRLKGIKATIFGQGQEFEGFGSKYAAVIPELEKLPPHSLVVMSDGRDVLINVHAGTQASLYSALAEFRKAYVELTHRYPGAIVVSAEAQCCVAALSHAKPGDFYNKDGSRNKSTCTFGTTECLGGSQDELLPWKRFMEDMARNRTRGQHDIEDVYLNAGLVAGQAGDLLRFVKAAAIGNHEDDQAVLTDYMYQNPNSILLDYRQQMFGNNRWVQGMSGGGCTYISSTVDKIEPAMRKHDERLVHSATKSTPLFLHSPGGFTECHDAMARKLGLARRTKRAGSRYELRNPGDRSFHSLTGFVGDRKFNYLAPVEDQKLDLSPGGLQVAPAGGIAEYSDHYEYEGQIMLLKWDLQGNLEVNRMESTISNNDHQDWFTHVVDNLLHAKPSSRGRVALLLNSDVMQLHWARKPPVPVIVYSLPLVAENDPNFLVIPNPYDSSTLNQLYIDWASEVKLTFNERYNKIVWRGELHYPDPELPRVKVLELARNESNSVWLDAGETGPSMTANSMTVQEMAHYRYQLDLYGVSGTTWGSLRWKMCSGFLVFKVDSPDKYKDWWHNEIMPWQHYVPVQHDLADLHEKWLWAEENPEKAAKIAQEGAELCLENSSRRNIASHFRRVLDSIPEATEAQVEEANAILEGRMEAVQITGW